MYRRDVLLRALPLGPHRWRFDRRASGADPATLRGQTMRDWLPPGPMSDWISFEALAVFTVLQLVTLIALNRIR